MQLNELQQKTKRITKKRVGRGGLRGKTSGRGHKGQKARAGHSLRPEMRDIIKKLPKLRGHGKNRARTINDSTVKPVPVNLSILEALFLDGDNVTPEILLEKKAVSRAGGKVPKVKILGMGTLSKKITISKCTVSKSAKDAVEKVGGTVIEIPVV
ncbi:MAG TPA: 50S ribosomal protein L15 [Candidatus Kaiserbacteria bacterium]|nr:50S ribosomal protein L15 [Candidatus Kaiserbacteria bacterium]